MDVDGAGNAGGDGAAGADFGGARDTIAEVKTMFEEVVELNLDKTKEITPEQTAKRFSEQQIQ